MIEAEILADSVNFDGDRLTTFRLKYPMAIHAQVMTHRVFSRNARSRRAMKPERFAVDCDWVPDFYGPAAEGSKMHAGPLDGRDKAIARIKWDHARAQALHYAATLESDGVHRFFSNVLTSPFAYTDVVLSSTKWAGFFEQRISDAAEPHLRQLAVMMRDAIESSVPYRLDWCDWHLPIVTRAELDTWGIAAARYISAGRCARVSYGADMIREATDDYKLGVSLQDAGHWSPFEHQAHPRIGCTGNNYVGWQQFRGMIEPQRRAEKYTGPTKEIER